MDIAKIQEQEMIAKKRLKLEQAEEELANLIHDLCENHKIVYVVSNYPTRFTAKRETINTPPFCKTCGRDNKGFLILEQGS